MHRCGCAGSRSHGGGGGGSGAVIAVVVFFGGGGVVAQPAFVWWVRKEGSEWRFGLALARRQRSPRAMTRLWR